ncbi:serine/threonine-protein phosphatase 6 regulatory subunit 3-like [Clytia hemisphaerica]
MKNKDAVNKLIVHIEISAIMVLFVKMVTVVETQEKKLEISKWLDDENLIGKLIELLKSSEKEEKHDNVSQLLCEVIKIGRDSISQYTEIEDPLLITLEKKETMQSLVGMMLEDQDGENSDSSIMAGVATFQSMMEITRPVIEGMEEIITPTDLERIANGIHSTLEVLSEHMDSFYKILSQPNTKTSALEMTYGTLQPPLGKVRLGIASLVCTSISTNTKIVNDAIAQTQLLSCLLDLFGRYEWNNFLHTCVQNCIIAILNTEADATPAQQQNHDGQDTEESTQPPPPVDNLLKHMFTDCNLVSWCVTLWKSNILSESAGPNGRKGYMGHLTNIMNEIVNAKERGPNHDHIISMFNELPEETREGWNEVVSNTLAETNERNKCQPLFPQGYADSESDSEPLDPGQRTNISLYDGTLQQAFENYQVQPMTNEFLESFGYDEAIVDDTEHLKNPFDDVGNIDFSINANEESENEKLFENICEQKIKPFDDSDEDDEEEDLWEEKQLTFNANSEPRTNKNEIRSDSDSSEEEQNTAVDEDEDESSVVTWSSSTANQNKKQQDADDVMDIDNDNSNDGKGMWTADFSHMDVQGTDSNGSSNWAAANATSTPTSVLSSSGDNFADFTDISNFGISGEGEGEGEGNDAPVAMETDGTTKPSIYEVKMDEDTADASTETKSTSPSEKTSSPITTQQQEEPSSQSSPEQEESEKMKTDEETPSAVETPAALISEGGNQQKEDSVTPSTSTDNIETTSSLPQANASQSDDLSPKGDNTENRSSPTPENPSSSSSKNDGDNKKSEETKIESSSSNETTKKDENSDPMT